MPDQPYETQRQAHAAAVAAIPPENGLSVLSAGQNRQLLGRALEAASVPMGRFGHEIAEWLSRQEDATVAEIARWIETAAQPPEGTVTKWGVRFDGPPPFRSQLSAYDTEAEARHQAAVTPATVSGWSATVMSREVTPWTEAPEPAEDEQHD